MANEKQKSRNAFNQQAADYDQGIKGSHARALYPVLLDKLSAISYHTALDLGCGTGEVMKRILEREPDKVLYGIDLSENMLEAARKKLGERVSLHLGDAEKLEKYFSNVTWEKAGNNAYLASGVLTTRHFAR